MAKLTTASSQRMCIRGQVEIDPVTLTSLLIKEASNLRKKLCSYAKDQLSGGLYWDPDVNVKHVLHQLKPSNDVCRS